jgi:hypothetical protein
MRVSYLCQQKRSQKDTKMFQEEIKLGIFYDMPREEYDAIPAVNQSLLNIFNECEEDAFAKIQGEEIEAENDSEAFSFGRDFHTYVLEPAVYEAQFIVEPPFGDLRFKENKEAKALWLDNNQGKTSVSEKDLEKMRGMKNRIMQDELVAALISQCRCEVSFFWRDEITGLNCKGRVDGFSESLEVMFDLKSCQSAKLGVFQNKIFQWYYHRQAGFYANGATTLGFAKPNYVVCAIEKKVPYKNITYEIPPEILELGKKEMRKLLDRFKVCVDTGIWPGYPKGIQAIGIPTWYLNKLGDEMYE